MVLADNFYIQTSEPEVKQRMEELLNEKEIVLNFDEQIVFDQLETKENAIWSLMVASGYLKVEQIEYKGMNAYMNEVVLATFSSFDTGSYPSGRTQPERFYHGFAFEGKKVLIGN